MKNFSGYDASAQITTYSENRLEIEADSTRSVSEITPEKMASLIYELQVHQIELEMQNDELCAAQEKLEASRAHYFNFYDLAPVGYVTISDKGLILEANLTVARFLGKARDELVNQPIMRFIFVEDQDIYYFYRKTLFENGGKKTCELRMGENSDTFFWAWLEATIAEHEDGVSFCRIVLSDITERKAIEAGLEKTRKELEIIKKSADEAHEFADSVINTVREPLISLGQDLRVVTVSRSFYEFFKVKPEETVGQLIYDLGNKQWDIPRLRELLENILPEKTTFDNYEVEHDFASIGKRTMLLNARQIEQGMGKERIILLPSRTSPSVSRRRKKRKDFNLCSSNPRRLRRLEH